MWEVPLHDRMQTGNSPQPRDMCCRDLMGEFPPRNLSLTLCINITYDQWNKQLVHLPFPYLILHYSQFYSQHVIDTFAPRFFLPRGRIRASFLGTRSHLRDQLRR